MKPFDLDKAKAGEPLCTRDGRGARIADFNLNEEGKRRLLVVFDSDYYEGDSYSAFTLEGAYWDDEDESENDLFMAPKVKEGWINLFRWDDDVIVSGVFMKHGDAEDSRNEDPDTFIKTIKVDWEE